MKGFAKYLIAGLIFILIGAIILVIGLGMSGWQLNPDYTNKIWTQEDGDITHLKVEFGAGEFKTVIYDGDKIEIEYQTSDVYQVKINQNAGKLTVETSNKWSFGFAFMFKSPKMTLKIPKNMNLQIFDFDMKAGMATLAGGEFGIVNIEISAGTLNFKNDLICDKLNLDMKAGSLITSNIITRDFKLDVSAGSANIGELNCSNTSIGVSAGSVQIRMSGFENDYNITVNKSAGSCNLTTHHYSPDNKTLDIDISAGSVHVNFTNR